MKITHNSHTKIILAAVAASVLIVGGLIGYAVYSSSWPFNSNEQQNKTSEETTSSTDNSREVDENNPAEVENPKASTQTEQQSRTETKSLNLTITSARQIETVVRVRTLIETVASSGICTLTATQSGSGKVITRTAKIQALPNGSTCTGFDIPTSEMTSGTWNATITATINNKSGSDEAKIEVK